MENENETNNEKLDETYENYQEIVSSEQQETPPRRPDIRIVQPTVDRDGKPVYKNVGGMWKNISKNGTEFYVLRIGDLRLLAFPATQK